MVIDNLPDQGIYIHKNILSTNIKKNLNESLIFIVVIMFVLHSRIYPTPNSNAEQNECKGFTVRFPKFDSLSEKNKRD